MTHGLIALYVERRKLVGHLLRCGRLTNNCEDARDLWCRWFEQIAFEIWTGFNSARAHAAAHIAACRPSSLASISSRSIGHGNSRFSSSENASLDDDDVLTNYCPQPSSIRRPASSCGRCFSNEPLRNIIMPNFM